MTEPHWTDVPGALRELAPVAPVGLRPLMLQAAEEIEHYKAIAELNHDVIVGRNADQVGAVT